MEPAGTALFLLGAAALLVGAATVTRLSGRLGVPSLLFFMVLGFLARLQHVVPISAPSAHVCFRLGTTALVFILFDGGLNTPIQAARTVLGPSLSLAILGTLLTAILTAGAAILLGFSHSTALLVGAALSSTDAAAVFSVLRAGHSRLHERVSLTLELESGLNDPMAVMLVVTATDVILSHEGLSWRAGAAIAMQLAAGCAIGALAGWGGGKLMVAARLPTAGLYPVLSISIAFAAFGVATLLQGSGFLAVYLASIGLGAGRLPYRASLRRVHDALAWMAQIIMFLVLGISVTPALLLGQVLPGIVLALVLTLGARPIAVLVSLIGSRFPWRERLFIAITGLRGAVPIVLVLFPVLRGVPGSAPLLDLVFVAVLCSSLFPGSTVAFFSHRLGLRQALPPPPPAGLEMVSHAEYDGEFVSYFVSRASAVAGARIRDLPLPETSVITLIAREREILAPRGDTEIRPGDHVYLFTTTADRSLADLIFGYEES